jgi:hypothetical protein
MSRRNFNRPQHQLRGRQTESVNGGNLSGLLGARPSQRQSKSKAEQRAELNRLVLEFRRREVAEDKQKS